MTEPSPCLSDWQEFERRGGVDHGLWPLAILVVLLLWPALAFGWLGKAWSDVPLGRRR